MRRIALDTGWSLKQRDPALSLADDFAGAAGWLPAVVPGGVFQALLAAGQIPNPFYGLNELDVQWVGERAWLYRCSFELAPADLAGPAAIAFDGLDTITAVFLNGKPLLTSQNMFLPAHAPAGHLLQAGPNLLQICFEPALYYGQQLAQARGAFPVWNGDPSRVYVRKAQYHYGWDWGPTLIDAGPWRPVAVELGGERIGDLHAPAALNSDLTEASLPTRLVAETDSSDGLIAQLTLSGPDGATLESVRTPLSGGVAEHRFAIAEPQLWWPNGYGAQPLYRLRAELLRDDEALDARELTIGLRRLRLVQEPVAGEPGSSFYFEVNNTPIFAGGANWIPADNLLGRVTPERYRQWLQLAVEANMVMLRVWGGGIYEDDGFYQLCDQLGLLVWQDFMFGCGIYPAYPAFRASVRAEAEAQIRRLRHHPSLALWCGNNEDYSLAVSHGRYDPARDPADDSEFPARAIYERDLPAICAALDPERPYRPGSPYASGADPDDPSEGDRHTWEVWGRSAPYTDYPRYAGRFVSEFGMPAAPALATVESFAPPDERQPHSRSFEHHNKATDGPARLDFYLANSFGPAADMEGYVYATQMLQAEALHIAFSNYRRRWGSPGRRAVGGALVWQLDDCWPVTSWAIVDSALRPKPAYYQLRRDLAPLALGLAHAGPGRAALWAANSSGAGLDGRLLLAAYSLEGRLLWEDRREVEIGPNGTSELAALDLPAGALLGARLHLLGGQAAQTTLWPEPPVAHALPDPGLSLAVNGDEVTIGAARPARGVWLDGGDGLAWSDNWLDLLPGETRRLHAAGLAGRPVTVRFAR